MTLIKSIAISCALLFSTVVAHADQEEYCNGSANRVVEMKQNMLLHSDSLNMYLEALEKSKASKLIKARLRHQIFFTHNRKHIADTDLWQLAFIDCIAKY